MTITRRAALALLVVPVFASVACAGAPTPSAPIPELPRAPSSASAAPRASAPGASPSSSVLASSLFAPGAPLEGNVVLSPMARLYPTAAAALAAPKPTEPPRHVDPGRMLVYPVIEAPTGVAKVRTEADTHDCARSRTDGFGEVVYAIEAYVPREQLVARLARTLLVEHGDGTGALVTKGALVRALPDGRGELFDEAMAKAVGTIPRERIALATTSTKEESAPSWARAFSPLACGPHPQSVDEWRATETERRRAEVAKQHEGEQERAYQACLERERKTPPAPPAAPGRRPTVLESLGKLTCSDLYASGVFGTGQSSLSALGDRGFGIDTPYCGAIAPENKPDLASRLDGRPFLTLRSLAGSSSGGSNVSSGTAGAYLAELPRTCGSLRVEVPAEAVRRSGSGAGLGGFGGGGAVRYSRKGSDVTWPDGTPAGKVTRSGVIRESELVSASDDRLCRKVALYAEPLCQSTKDLCRTPECRDRP